VRPDGVEASAVVPLTSVALFPELVSLPDGSALLAWSEEGEGGSRIGMVRLRADG
jgi:hypothetical protein